MSKNLCQFPQIPGNCTPEINVRKLTTTATATVKITKIKRELNMVGAPGVNDYIVNELH